jgi:sugar-phosphatase
LRTLDGVNYWYARYPWTVSSTREVAERITQRGLALIWEQGTPLPGAKEAVCQLARSGIPLALASSSEAGVIAAVLAKLDVTDSFQQVHSAEHELYGKPPPAVYLTAAKRLGVPPEACLDVEDTVTGVVAAKAARMTCVAVPAPEVNDDRRFGLADAVLPSLTHLNADLLDALAA